MRQNAKAGRSLHRSGSNQKVIAGGNILDFFNFKSIAYFGQQCAGCKTDDLKYAVENVAGLFCRRCEQKVEYIKREKPHVIEAVRREAVRV